MAYAAGSGNTKSHKNITTHLMLEHDEDENVVTVIATQSMFGLKLWGAVDKVCWLHSATLRINPQPTAEDIQPAVVRRVSKEDKRIRNLKTMVDAKRGR